MKAVSFFVLLLLQTISYGQNQYYYEGDHPGSNYGNSFMVIVWSLFILGSVYFNKTMNRSRIRDYFKERQCEVISINWEPFGAGWAGDKNSIYQVRYYDKKRQVKEVTVKTALFSGVYVTNDKTLQGYAKHEAESDIDDQVLVEEEEIEAIELEIERLQKKLSDIKKNGLTKRSAIVQSAAVKKFNYECDVGLLEIEQEFHSPNIGEKVYLNGRTAPDGKYKLGFLRFISVVDGMVEEITIS